ncbi:hypothetical protein [Antribacter gilvus]|uniref:hypothetical protein n=1 Tax=Antribacter gilvus TaxID=2304675 RepID=UPI000F7BA7C5|nr:hypothetical protein [Antribacter gilvus]
MLDRRILAVAAAAALAVVGTVLPAAPAQAVASHAQLALRWAPVHHQDVDQTGDHALGGRADYVTRIDFDGDWTARDNWDDAARAGVSFAAVSYYSVVETSTHWYLTYLFFHPRDWVDQPFDSEHENDAEGLLLAVEKDGSTYGVLRGAVTVAHTNFYSYTPSGSTWSSGRESVDGTLNLAASPVDGLAHPVTAQEAKGHGLKAHPQYQINGDGVVYYPSTVSEAPSGPNDRDVRYALVDMLGADGLWSRRADAGLFASHGAFAGDTSGGCGSGTFGGCGTNSANAPWGWDDGDDLPARGELATDPAKLVAEYFTIPGTFSRTYVSNPYRG